MEMPHRVKISFETVPLNEEDASEFIRDVVNYIIKSKFKGLLVDFEHSVRYVNRRGRYYG